MAAGRANGRRVMRQNGRGSQGAVKPTKRPRPPREQKKKREMGGGERKGCVYVCVCESVCMRESWATGNFTQPGVGTKLDKTHGVRHVRADVWVAHGSDVCEEA